MSATATSPESRNSFAGETWAVVYAYEPPRRPTGRWYDRWRYDVINDYIKAISMLDVEPFVIDVDGFIKSNTVRDEVNFVINLNSGATPLSNLGLVPSFAQWCGLGCFPNSADVILAGERKDICKEVFTKWFRVPADLSSAPQDSSRQVILKPKTMGNSRGVTRSVSELDNRQYILEEFIPGYDVTVPVFFDTSLDDYVVAPAIIYIPDVSDPEQWFLSHDQKLHRSIAIERRVHKLNDGIASSIAEASRFFSYQSLARFDFRWRTKGSPIKEMHAEDLWFLEINCLPTLRTGVNFIESIKAYMKKERPEELLKLPGDDDDIKALAFFSSKQE